MPLPYASYEKRLKKADEKLDKIFSTSESNPDVEKHINEIKRYYRLSYKKAQQEETIEEILKSYEIFAQHLESIKQTGAAYEAGKMSHEDTEKEYKKAYDYTYHAKNRRYINILKNDCFKLCKLLFLASAAAALYASIYLIALPMFLVQPLLGIPMLATIGGFMLKTAYDFFKCFTEFRFPQVRRHYNECQSEVSLYKFFLVKKEEAPENKKDHHSHAETAPPSPAAR